MTRLILATLVALTVIGCREDGDTPAPAGDETETTIPFRKDAELTFYREGEPFLDIAVEIAATDSARARGMMQRKAFPNDRSGMLFLFDREEIQSFWMANTPVPLDLIFISADSQIVDIHKYARPFSSENITSDAPARYVLEVPAGFTDARGVIETDRVRWHRE